jgi:type I restriction enzyme M protein
VTDARRLVDKLWSYCNVLRDDGVSTIEYTEQLTYLLFLKMAHERENRPLKPERIVPPECSWQRLLDADGDELETTYRHILEQLGRQPGTLGVIFRKAQNRIQGPAKLKRLVVDLIDKENWSAAGVDIKGDAYEELLSKGAEDIKSGAGQYFTPGRRDLTLLHMLYLPPPGGTGAPLTNIFRFDSVMHESARLVPIRIQMGSNRR